MQCGHSRHRHVSGAFQKHNGLPPTQSIEISFARRRTPLLVMQMGCSSERQPSCRRNVGVLSCGKLYVVIPQQLLGSWSGTVSVGCAVKAAVLCLRSMIDVLGKWENLPGLCPRFKINTLCHPRNAPTVGAEGAVSSACSSILKA